jgi:hypothetical protein
MAQLLNLFSEQTPKIDRFFWGRARFTECPLEKTSAPRRFERDGHCKRTDARQALSNRWAAF